MNDGTTTESALVRLAETLTYALRIRPEGRELVPLIGDGRTACNREAVEVWILRQARMPDPDIARRLLPLLIQRLEEEIADER